MILINETELQASHSLRIPKKKEQHEKAYKFNMSKLIESRISINEIKEAKEQKIKCNEDHSNEDEWIAFHKYKTEHYDSNLTHLLYLNTFNAPKEKDFKIDLEYIEAKRIHRETLHKAKRKISIKKLEKRTPTVGSFLNTYYSGFANSEKFNPIKYKSINYRGYWDSTPKNLSKNQQSDKFNSSAIEILKNKDQLLTLNEYRLQGMRNNEIADLYIDRSEKHERQGRLYKLRIVCSSGSKYSLRPYFKDERKNNPDSLSYDDFMDIYKQIKKAGIDARFYTINKQYYKSTFSLDFRCNDDFLYRNWIIAKHLIKDLY